MIGVQTVSDNKPDWWDYLVEPKAPKDNKFDLTILLGAIAAVIAVLVFLIVLI